MFTRIQAQRYRCLQNIDQELGAFQALVGANASGKSTFLDVIGLLGDLVRNGGRVRETVAERSEVFKDLVWMGEGQEFHLAVEARIPEGVRANMSTTVRTRDIIRYEIAIGVDEDGVIGLNHEKLWFSDSGPSGRFGQRSLFPDPSAPEHSIFVSSGRARKLGISHDPQKYAKFYPDGKQTYKPTFRLGRGTAAIANIPADSESFVASQWFKEVLADGVQVLALDSREIRTPSPPGSPRTMLPDGSNLPFVIDKLREEDEKRFKLWLNHVRTALPDVNDIRVKQRPEDLNKYLSVIYDSNAEVPSWLVSDGTLRLLALTILAYLPNLTGVYLIEEPENGIHPKGIDAALDSLSSVYDGQVLIATHSVVALSKLQTDQVLCFAKDSTGAVDIVRGDSHPALKDWRQGAPGLDVLFASGVLG